jgi:hypothetical protein
MRIGNFHQDLKLGQSIEKIAQQRIIKYFDNDISITDINDDNKYDFKISNNERFEVKYDRMSEITGNIFIEYYCRGKKSGISITQSDYHIIAFTDKDMYLIPTERLKEMIINEDYIRKYSDYIKAGYIFKKSKIIENSIKI